MTAEKMCFQPKIEIQDCIFSFKCPKQWDSLTVTENPSVRHCEACKENVYFCKTRKALKAAVKRGKCVAVEIDPIYSDKVIPNIHMGRMMPDSLD